MRSARLLLLPSILCAIMVTLALLLAVTAGISGAGLVADYIRAGSFCAFVALLLWVCLPWLRGPVYRPMSPLKALCAMMHERWLFALLPCLLFPVFMSGFTVVKVGIPHLVGYQWDGFWTDADHLLFGVDPWQVTHSLFGVQATKFLSFSYTLYWGLAFGLGLPLYAMSASPTQAIRAYTAMMTTWLAAGVGGALLFSSVGPVFADLANHGLGLRFAPLRESLGAVLPADDGILYSQQYLRRAYNGTAVVRAGGISAMPSMHLAVCTILVILAWRGFWRLPAIFLWIVIWVGSIHFGYHYALDGILGAAIAWLCWKATAPLSSRAEIEPRPAVFALQ